VQPLLTSAGRRARCCSSRCPARRCRSRRPARCGSSVRSPWPHSGGARCAALHLAGGCPQAHADFSTHQDGGDPRCGTEQRGEGHHPWAARIGTPPRLARAVPIRATASRAAHCWTRTRRRRGLDQNCR
jgi:hypothetical protein